MIMFSKCRVVLDNIKYFCVSFIVHTLLYRIFLDVVSVTKLAIGCKTFRLTGRLRLCAVPVGYSLCMLFYVFDRSIFILYFRCKYCMHYLWRWYKYCAMLLCILSVFVSEDCNYGAGARWNLIFSLTCQWRLLQLWFYFSWFFVASSY